MNKRDCKSSRKLEEKDAVYTDPESVLTLESELMDGLSFQDNGIATHALKLLHMVDIRKIVLRALVTQFRNQPYQPCVFTLVELFWLLCKFMGAILISFKMCATACKMDQKIITMV